MPVTPPVRLELLQVPGILGQIASRLACKRGIESMENRRRGRRARATQLAADDGNVAVAAGLDGRLVLDIVARALGVIPPRDVHVVVGEMPVSLAGEVEHGRSDLGRRRIQPKGRVDVIVGRAVASSWQVVRCEVEVLPEVGCGLRRGELWIDVALEVVQAQVCRERGVRWVPVAEVPGVGWSYPAVVSLYHGWVTEPDLGRWRGRIAAMVHGRQKGRKQGDWQQALHGGHPFSTVDLRLSLL